MRKVIFGLPLALAVISAPFEAQAQVQLSPVAGPVEPSLAGIPYLTEDWEVMSSAPTQDRSPVAVRGHPVLRLAVGTKARRSKPKVESWQEILSAEQQRTVALEAQRDDLMARNAALRSRLIDMRVAQQAVLDRVRRHTLQGIVNIEDALAVTGLGVGVLLPDDSLGEPAMGQGGPFIPGDALDEPNPVEAVRASLAGLDLQIERWERLQALLSNLPLAAPLEQYRITSTFGKRRDPINGKTSKHHGIDFKAALGTPVLSTAPGKVVFAGRRGGLGRLVEIDHGYGIRSRYAHLKKLEVKRGDLVSHRQKIGLLGTSGRSTGAHVHYEVLVQGRARDPLKFLEVGMNLFKDFRQGHLAAFEAAFP